METVRNNQQSMLPGVFVKDSLALKVLPADTRVPLYVTMKPGAVTNSCGISECRSIWRFQILSPNDLYSAFVDLGTRGAQLFSSDVFAQTFRVSNRLMLQTCITANRVLTWGRLFVIAEPMRG